MSIHVHITGHLTKNAEFKTIGDNQVLNFAVATDHGYGDKKQALFVNCALWGKRGSSLVNYLTKGSQVVVHGELFTREYQTKDGSMKTTLECRVNELDLVGGKREEKSKEKSEESPSYAHQKPEADFDDDISF